MFGVLVHHLVTEPQAVRKAGGPTPRMLNLIAWMPFIALMLKKAV